MLMSSILFFVSTDVGLGTSLEYQVKSYQIFTKYFFITMFPFRNMHEEQYHLCGFSLTTKPPIHIDAIRSLIIVKLGGEENSQRAIILLI